MITIKNVRTLEGKIIDFTIFSARDETINGEGLLLFPGIIDSHISLGSPDNEIWKSSITSLLKGGVTTILDIPSLDFPSESKKDLELKRSLVDKHLSNFNLPLHYFFYNKGNSAFLEQMGLEKKFILGSLILLNFNDHLDEGMWDRIFQMAAWQDLPIVINSQNENSWEGAKFKKEDETFLEKAISYTEKQNARLYVLNIATQDELDLIREAREKQLLIYTETTTKQLFPENSAHADFLWEALNEGIIDLIGSGYQVNVPDHRKLNYKGKNFDFSHPIFLLPLLLTAHHEGKITLENIARLTSVNLYDIFSIKKSDEDIVLIDLDKEQIVQKTDHDNVNEMRLKGWPIYTIVGGEIFKSEA